MQIRVHTVLFRQFCVYCISQVNKLHHKYTKKYVVSIVSMFLFVCLRGRFSSLPQDFTVYNNYTVTLPVLTVFHCERCWICMRVLPPYSLDRCKWATTYPPTYNVLEIPWIDSAMPGTALSLIQQCPKQRWVYKKQTNNEFSKFAQSWWVTNETI